MNVLVVDIGGTHVKILTTGQDTPRQCDSGPMLTPKKMVSQVRKLSSGWRYDVVSVGYPGPVLRGRPVSEPPNLGAGWVGFNFEAAFKRPVKLVNDAAMQALGSYKGGKMLFLGLGTGLGSTMIVDGIVEPMELGHLPYKKATFEDYIGVRGLEDHGRKKWRQYVLDVVQRLFAALEPDYVVLGGGNVKNLHELPAGCQAGDNANAFVGGFRLWKKRSKRNASGRATVCLALMLALLFRARVARAQESPLPSAPSEVATNLMALMVAAQSGDRERTNTPSGFFGVSSSASSQVPVDLRPFQLALPRAHLFDDWFGLLPKLHDRGIVPTLTFVSDVAGNVSGGESQGVTHADNLGLDLLFDLEKLADLKGASFLVSMSQRSGNSLSQEHVGNVFTIQQVYGGQTFHLIDVAYQQKLLDDRVEFRLGRIATGDDFLVSQYDYLFMQNGFDGTPVGIFFNSPGMTAYPNATWGARLKVRPTQRTYVMGGVYNGDPSIRDIDHNGTDMSMNGPVFAIGEVGYQRNGLPGDSPLLGNYKAGIWYDNSTYTDFETVGLGRSSGTRRGNWGFYSLFDQVLVPFGDPASNRGFGVFGTMMVSPNESASQMPYFFAGGIAFRGIFASRPTDSAGFGVVYGSFSSDLRHAQEREQQLDPTVGVQTYETVLECTYRFYFRKGALFFQPDIQYVIRPGGTGRIDDALVLGCQVGVNL